MAAKKSDKQDEGDESAEEVHDAQECMPCRGAGQLISNLGGKPSTVPCPWCAGTGKRTPGIDAQQGWLEQDGGESDSNAASDEAAA